MFFLFFHILGKTKVSISKREDTVIAMLSCHNVPEHTTRFQYTLIWKKLKLRLQMGSFVKIISTTFVKNDGFHFDLIF